MAEQRRSLVEGLKPVAELHPEAEEAFVFGGSTRTSPALPTEAARRAEPLQGGNGVGPFAPVSPPATAMPTPHLGAPGRVGLTTRIRPDLGSALKRLSLQRQLAGIHPWMMQDIIEEALELWFLKNETPT